MLLYPKTCLKQPLKKDPKIGFQDQLLLNAGQKYCRMLQSAKLWPSLSTNLPLKPLFCPFLNCRVIPQKQNKKNIVLNSIFLFCLPYNGTKNFKMNTIFNFNQQSPGCLAQWVKCLATDASLTADPRVPRSIPARSHTFMEIWNNFYCHSPPFGWIIQEGLLSVTSESICTKCWLTACSSLARKKV